MYRLNHCQPLNNSRKYQVMVFRQSSQVNRSWLAMKNLWKVSRFQLMGGQIMRAEQSFALPLIKSTKDRLSFRMRSEERRVGKESRYGLGTGRRERKVSTDERV